MTLRTGLRTSSNRAAVRLLQDVGIAKTVQFAKNMGIGDVPSVPSLALGSGEVTLEAMTAAYAAFANHGLVPQAILIRRVEDQDGRVLYDAHASTTRAISDTTAFLMSTMMADVINAGTANKARQLGFKLPAAGKTGTTNDFHDAWFVGYTTKLVTGVWVGFDQPRTKFMSVATANDKPEWLTTPPGITTANVCRISGLLATDGCQDVEVVVNTGEIARRSMVYTEYFARGTVPAGYCDLHPKRGFLTTLAGVFGKTEMPPPPRIEDTGAGASAVPAAMATTGSTDRVERAETTPPPAAPKKRRFWSRIFGIGRDSEPNQDKEPPQPKKKRGG
jgi:penicillin-binding protein 1A